MSFTSNLNFHNNNNNNQNNHYREHKNNDPYHQHTRGSTKNVPTPANPGPNQGNCPEGWRSHGPSCFFFGDHQNYDDAEYHCGKANGKLATITNINSKFLISYIRTESSGNDHWIQDSRLSGNSRAPQPANGKCPLIKGASVKTAFTSAICNSAYPFICEKNQVLVPPAGFFGNQNFGGQNAQMGMNNGFNPNMNNFQPQPNYNGYNQNNIPSINPYNNFVQVQQQTPMPRNNNPGALPENHRYTMNNMRRNKNSRQNNIAAAAPPQQEFTSLDDLDFEVQSSNIGGNLNFGTNTRGQNRFSDAIQEEIEVPEEKPLSSTITGIVVTASLILTLLGALYFWHVRKVKRKRIKLQKQQEAQNNDNNAPS